MFRTFLKYSVSGSLLALVGLTTGFVSTAQAGDPPSVSAVSPAAAQVGVPVSFSATYAGFFGGVGNCYLSIDGGSGLDAMTQSGSGSASSMSGSVSQSYTFSAAGTHTASVKCGDGIVGGTTSVNVSDVVSASAGTPSIGAIPAQSATVGTAIVISADYQGFSGNRKNTCHLLVDGMLRADTMSLAAGSTDQSGTLTQSYTFSSQGTHTLGIQCGTADDLTYNIGTSVTVAAAATSSGSSSSVSDTSKPVVSAITPTVATVGVPQTFSATYSDTGTGVSYCEYSAVGGGGRATMVGSPLSGTVSITRTFTSVGTASIIFFCYDGAGNYNVPNWTTITVSAAGTDAVATGGTGTTPSDSTPPAVGAVSPATAALNTPTVFSATYSDAVGVTACYLYVNGLNVATMDRSAADSASSSAKNGTASASYTFSSQASVGANTIRVECTDAAGNRGVGSNASVTVSASAATTSGATDTTTPVVNAITASAATVNAPVALSTTYSDATGVSACYLYVDSVSMGAVTRTGTAISGTASMNYTFTTGGNHTARMECVDAAGNRGVGSNKTIAVSGSATTAADTTLPTVNALNYASVMAAGTASRFETTVADAGGVSSCSLLINGVSAQAMSLASGSSGYTSVTAAANYLFTLPGTYNVRTECVDVAGNHGLGPVSTVSVGAVGSSTATTSGSSASANAPTVSAVYPGNVGAGAQTSYAVSFTSPIAVNGCSFYVNDVYTGVMGLSGTATNGAANYLHVFSTPGTYQVRVECVDSSGRRGVGSTGTVTVTGATSVTPNAQGSTPTAPSATGATPSTEIRTTLPPVGSLIKSPCPDGAASDNPCKAVYYYGRNGTRYAFPHERIFLTWYANFDSVIQVSDAVMASIRLAGNVTYRPGVRLLKFTTVPQVYAVGRGGVLRWVTSEALAVALYGPNWNQNVHDIPDGYFNNYRFGADINTVSDFSPVAESATTPTIDDNR